jgi:hypothetical protein
MTNWNMMTSTDQYIHTCAQGHNRHHRYPPQSHLATHVRVYRSAAEGTKPTTRNPTKWNDLWHITSGCRNPGTTWSTGVLVYWSTVVNWKPQPFSLLYRLKWWVTIDSASQQDCEDLKTKETVFANVQIRVSIPGQTGRTFLRRSTRTGGYAYPVQIDRTVPGSMCGRGTLPCAYLDGWRNSCW